MSGSGELQGWARTWLGFVLDLDRPLTPLLVQDGDWAELPGHEVAHRLAALPHLPDGTHAVVWVQQWEGRDALWIDAVQLRQGRVLARAKVAQPVQVDPATGHGVAAGAPAEVGRRGHSAKAWVAAATVGVVVGLVAVLGLMLATGRTGVPVGQPPTPSATTPPPTPAAALEAQRADDAATVETLVGQWVPQVSAKSVGLVVDGVTFDEQRILADYQALAQRYPDAVLLRSADYTSFRAAGFWVTVVPRTFPSAADANAWCDGEGFASEDCFAKRLSRTEGPEGNSAPR